MLASRRRALRRAGLAPVAVLAALALPTSAPAATSLIAAYDKYVPGKGFEIGLVDVGTGVDIAVPAGVNTTDDELHPALTPDGRFLVFTRMQVRPLLNGDTIPPAGRTLAMVDLSNGSSRTPIASEGATGAGPMITPGPSGQARLAYGLRPPAGRTAATTARILTAGRLDPPGFVSIPGDFLNVTGPVGNESDTRVLDIPSATVFQRADGRTHGYTRLLFDRANGQTTESAVVIESREGTSSAPSASFSVLGAMHPALRYPDGYAVFATAVRTQQLRTILVGAQTTADEAPDPINDDESFQNMPAWSPDGTKLAFVRRSLVGSDLRRKLLAYDATPGIQTILNDPINLGDPAPTGQLRVFEDTWGNISLAVVTRPDATTVSCTSLCLTSLSGLVTRPLTLKPSVVGAVSTSSIGILVARVVGTRKLLGRTVPRLKPLGRVPLGKPVRGRNAFTWSGRVAGKALGAGDYVLTYRALTKKGRIEATSRSIRFSVGKSGRISNVRTLPG